MRGEGRARWPAWRASLPRCRGAAPTGILSTQGRLAGEIERLLFEETLIIYAYFYDTLFASQKNITGVGPAPTGQLLLWNAVKT